MSIDAAAKQTRVTPAYLRQALRHGTPFVLAEHLARAAGVGLDDLMGSESPMEAARRRCRERRRAKLERGRRNGHDLSTMHDGHDA
jgi:hypothetical protein